MASSRKFLCPLRKSLAAITSSTSFTAQSHPTQLFYAKCEPLKRLMMGFEPVLRTRVSGFQYISDSLRINFQNFYSLGKKIRIGSVLDASAICGSISFLPHVSCAMDDLDNWAYDHHGESWGASDVEEDPHPLWKFAKKFWLPLFFFLTVLAHLDDPLTVIALKVLLFLLSTNPSPFSVYVFVDELCNRSMRQEPQLYGRKSLYAHKVEVQDYKLLCLAKVEVRDQKFTLLGILGGWWALPMQSQGPFSILGT